MTSPADPLSHGLSEHVEDQLIALLAHHLRIGDDELAKTLRTEPDHAIVEAVGKAVRRVELVYEKKAGTGPTRYDLGVEIHFEDGRLDRRINEVDATWLPGDVTESFAKTGAARVHRPWGFPWERETHVP